MKLKKRVIGKVALGLVLIVLAGCVAYAVKDLLAYRKPESTLPIISIECNGTELTRSDNWMMESYSWRYLTLVREWHAEEDAVKALPALPAMPGAAIDITFTPKPQTVKVSRSKDGGECAELQGELQTPVEPGEYTYHVQSQWGVRGTVNYYFKLRILE